MKSCSLLCFLPFLLCLFQDVAEESLAFSIFTVSGFDDNTSYNHQQ